METVYLFDVDGTLTPPLEPIDEEFAEVFLTWARKGSKKVYLVTGSDLPKIKRQLFSSFIDQCDGIFTCSGNAFYSKGRLVKEQELVLPSGFIEDLELYLEHGSPWRTKTGNHIEVRTGMVNFSTVGRNASSNLRTTYHEWDKIHEERLDIIDYITKLYPEFEASIGGTISVDIYPCGKNKAQVVSTIHELHGDDISIIFVGDRNVPTGNDWPLAQKLDTLNDCRWLQVGSYNETWTLIEYSELFI